MLNWWTQVLQKQFELVNIPHVLTVKTSARSQTQIDCEVVSCSQPVRCSCVYKYELLFFFWLLSAASFWSVGRVSARRLCSKTDGLLRLRLLASRTRRRMIQCTAPSGPAGTAGPLNSSRPNRTGVRLDPFHVWTDGGLVGRTGWRVVAVVLMLLAALGVSDRRRSEFGAPSSGRRTPPPTPRLLQPIQPHEIYFVSCRLWFSARR